MALEQALETKLSLKESNEWIRRGRGKGYGRGQGCGQEKEGFITSNQEARRENSVIRGREREQI